MPPVASTSTAQLPGFRTSRPKRAAATAGAGKTRASLRGGKARRLEDRAYDAQGEVDGEYAPLVGQVKRRRKKERVVEGKGKKRAREEEEEEEDDAEDEAALEKIERKRARKRAKKEARRQEQLAQVRAREAEEDARPPDKAPKAKGKAKKRVRIDLPPSDSDGEGGGAREAVRPGEGEDDPAAGADEDDDDDLALEDIDLADPRTLPLAERRRGRRFWRALEHGVYRSALHDVATDKAHLGRALVEWEALRRARAREEADEKAQEDAVRTARDVSRAASGSASPTPPPKKRRPGVGPHNPHRSLTPFDVAPPDSDGEADEGAHLRPRRTFDDDGHEVLPLPSSTALARMARWPQHDPARSRAGLSVSSDALEDAVLAAFERAQRLAPDGPALPRPRLTRPRSAYGADAPFAAEESDPSSSSSEDDDDAGDDPLADESEPIEWDDAPAAVAAVPALLSSMLLRLTDCIPKAPLPALDLTKVKKRFDQMVKDDKKRGIDREGRAVGWEEVVAVARESGVGEHIVDKLEEQLVALFGPSTRPPVKLPSKGNPTKIRIPRPRRLKKRAKKPVKGKGKAAKGSKRGKDKSKKAKKGRKSEKEKSAGDKPKKKRKDKGKGKAPAEGGGAPEG
ncbi:hypothetical protein JCM10449v2_003131 [Rhodotorula kratochvilovae]